MSDATPHKISKWPFLSGDILLVVLAVLVHRQAPEGSVPLISLVVLCVLAGAVLGVLPFILEYRVTVRLAEAAALGTVMSQLKGVETVAAQIKSATENWQNIQEHSDKAAAASRAIAERMTAEVRAFGDFMQRVNDNEKANLRLEVEKLRRAESDWLQVLVRTMDHVFALHKGALKSGQPAVIEQLTNFQNACREAARRVGLAPFLPANGDAYDPARHQLIEGKTPVSADGKIAEAIAAGYTFQGRLLRPALVRLESESDAAPSAESAEKAPPQTQLGF